MKINEILTEEIKQRLDAKCWSGYKKQGTKIKGGTRVNNCVPAESVAEGSDQNGWYVLDTKNRKIIANDVSKERAIAIAKSGGYTVWQTENGTFINSTRTVRYPGLGWIDVSEGICSIQEANAIFDDFERSVAARGLTEDIFDSITDEQIIAETAAWRRKAGKNKNGGLNAKGVASYRRENPGSKLQTAVTTKPSKLKKGSKAAKRRKSFCARMSGVKGPMKKPNGKPTRKALALRKWNC